MSRSQGSTETPQTRIVVAWYRLVVGFTFGAVVGCFGILATSAQGPEDFVPILLLMAVCLVISVRGFRCATVVVDADSVTIRTVLRRRRIPRTEIHGVSSARGSSVVLGGWRIPVLLLSDGRQVRLEEIRSWRNSNVAAELDALLTVD
jgi:hypothetical protein